MRFLRVHAGIPTESAIDHEVSDGWFLVPGFQRTCSSVSSFHQLHARTESRVEGRRINFSDSRCFTPGEQTVSKVHLEAPPLPHLSRVALALDSTLSVESDSFAPESEAVTTRQIPVVITLRRAIDFSKMLHTAKCPPHRRSGLVIQQRRRLGPSADSSQIESQSLHREDKLAGSSPFFTENFNKSADASVTACCVQHVPCHSPAATAAQAGAVGKLAQLAAQAFPVDARRVTATRGHDTSTSYHMVNHHGAQGLLGRLDASRAVAASSSTWANSPTTCMHEHQHTVNAASSGACCRDEDTFGVFPSNSDHQGGFSGRCQRGDSLDECLNAATQAGLRAMSETAAEGVPPAYPQPRSASMRRRVRSDPMSDLSDLTKHRPRHHQPSQVSVTPVPANSSASCRFVTPLATTHFRSSLRGVAYGLLKTSTGPDLLSERKWKAQQASSCPEFTIGGDRARAAAAAGEASLATPQCADSPPASTGHGCLSPTVDCPGVLVSSRRDLSVYAADTGVVSRPRWASRSPRSDEDRASSRHSEQNCFTDLSTAAWQPPRAVAYKPAVV